MKFKLVEITKGHLTSVPGGKAELEEPPAQGGEDQYDPGAWDEATPPGFESNPDLEKIQGDVTSLDKIQSRLDNIKKALRFKLVKSDEN